MKTFILLFFLLVINSCGSLPIVSNSSSKSSLTYTVPDELFDKNIKTLSASIEFKNKDTGNIKSFEIAINRETKKATVEIEQGMEPGQYEMTITFRTSFEGSQKPLDIANTIAVLTIKAGKATTKLDQKWTTLEYAEYDEDKDLINNFDEITGSKGKISNPIISEANLAIDSALKIISVTAKETELSEVGDSLEVSLSIENSERQRQRLN